MKIIDYLKDRLLFLVINIILFMAIASIMIMTDVALVIIFITFIIWFIPLIVYMLLEVFKSKKYYEELISINENLDKKYLISEIIEKPHFAEGKMLYEILKSSNRSMQENVNYYKNLQVEYQEYIETWVHEIKTPIASIMLTIENNEESIPFTIKDEIRKTENYIDQVLYYSRSNDVSKDYIIKEFNLENSIRKVIRKNASDFINKKIYLDIKDVNYNVYSDSKWFEFILNQIIINAIKYSNKDCPKIHIDSVRNKNNIVLSIIDNGIGINERDINRVFEKGFTGENGRLFGKSTGIGLYLCKKLCDKLGLGIQLNSDINEGTEVKIIFPIDKYKLISKID